MWSNDPVRVGALKPPLPIEALAIHVEQHLNRNGP